MRAGADLDGVGYQEEGPLSDVTRAEERNNGGSGREKETGKRQNGKGGGDETIAEIRW